MSTMLGTAQAKRIADAITQSDSLAGFVVLTEEETLVVESAEEAWAVAWGLSVIVRFGD